VFKGLTMVSAGFHCLPLQMVRPYLKRETEDVLLHTHLLSSLPIKTVMPYNATL